MVHSQEFYIGDQVKIISGGPVMTVYAIGHYCGIDDISCCWFDVHDIYHKQNFSCKILQKI